jgi:hypothetical protein
MGNTRRELLETLETHYRESGWRVKRGNGATVFADGPGGVTWIGAAVIRADLEEDGVEERLKDLAERRMEGGGELCPFELLPSPDCKDELQELLERIGIAGRGNVAVYSFAS